MSCRSERARRSSFQTITTSPLRALSRSFISLGRSALAPEAFSFAALSEFERDLLRQRVNAGLKAARRRGRVGGRPKALTEADLKKARALLRSGEYTKVEVAKELEISRHTLWRALLQSEGN
jgi:hypothetical protein